MGYFKNKRCNTPVIFTLLLFTLDIYSLQQPNLAPGCVLFSKINFSVENNHAEICESQMLVIQNCDIIKHK